MLGGFGAGLAKLEQALIHHKTPTDNVQIVTTRGQVRLPALLADTSDLYAFLNKRDLRRTDRYIQMALLASYYALEDAVMLTLKRRRMGIIVATGYGSTCNTFDLLNRLEDTSEALISPTEFSNSVHNAAAGQISIFLDEMGPNLTVSDHDMSIPSAFLTAVQWLQEERVDAVLLGGVDEYCQVLGHYWHSQYNDTAGDGNTVSIDTKRHAIIGEGACFFVLTREEEAAPRYGFIEDIQMGNFLRGRIRLPENALFFIGADGYSPCENYYADIIPANAETATYTPLYGGIPIGPAFDVAIAALTVRSGTVRRPFKSGFGPDRLNMNSRDGSLDSERICCVKLGADGAFGSIVLNTGKLMNRCDTADR